MNYSTSVMLIHDAIRAVKVNYDPSSPDTTFKTLDPDLQVGDIVVVPTETRHGMTTARVSEVDVEVDFQSGPQVRWIVSKVDATEYHNILDNEKKWLDVIRNAERSRMREEAKKSIAAFQNEESLKLLSLTTVDAKAADSAE